MVGIDDIARTCVCGTGMVCAENAEAVSGLEDGRVGGVVVSGESGVLGVVHAFR